jgi:chemotaxis regulatin CheY-phosphate phosphatase CheZ
MDAARSSMVAIRGTQADLTIVWTGWMAGEVTLMEKKELARPK